MNRPHVRSFRFSSDFVPPLPLLSIKTFFLALAFVVHVMRNALNFSILPREQKAFQLDLKVIYGEYEKFK